MKKIDFKNIKEHGKFHAGIIANGLMRTLYGAAVAGMFAAAVCGFIHTASRSGYTAVFEFAVSCCILAFAFGNVYFSGCGMRGAKE